LGVEKDFHALRHTFETGIRDAGVSETLAAELAGHSKGTSESYNRYAKGGNMKNLQEAINKLPPIRGGRRDISMVFPGNGKRGGTIEVSTIGERYAVCKVFCQPAFRNQSGANLKPIVWAITQRAITAGR
jgi:hypothetical protein